MDKENYKKECERLGITVKESLSLVAMWIELSLEEREKILEEIGEVSE